MKKSITGSMVVLLVLFLSVGLGLAANGSGAGDGSGPIHDIYAGTPFTYAGDVFECLGDGMLISTANGNVTVFGIGPVRYWDSLEVIRPVAGDTVTVTGYTVDYNGDFRNIAVTVTIGDKTVPLRDAVTGAPLWRQGGRK
jgi:hypothetical protein